MFEIFLGNLCFFFDLGIFSISGCGKRFTTPLFLIGNLNPMTLTYLAKHISFRLREIYIRLFTFAVTHLFQRFGNALLSCHTRFVTVSEWDKIKMHMRRCFIFVNDGVENIKIRIAFRKVSHIFFETFDCFFCHFGVACKARIVSFASTQSQFNVLDVQNFSEDGVVFSTAATVVELLDNGCNVSFANGERSGWTLEEDEIVDGDLNLSRGTLDLNGHKLTVTGNLVQSGGSVLVNGGELDVQGDYRVQALNGGNYTTSTGTLTMKNDSDTVKVGGDFIMQSTRSHSELLSAGTLEIGGNLT